MHGYTCKLSVDMLDELGMQTYTNTHHLSVASLGVCVHGLNDYAAVGESQLLLRVKCTYPPAPVHFHPQCTG